tara:strand:- start:149 stop:457 length:309 start_codon:yes stop_codon:yes gene_type:complete
MNLEKYEIEMEKIRLKGVEMAYTQAKHDVFELKQKPNNDVLLSLYGLFKQIEVGDCNTKKPFIINIRKRSKYDAWVDIKHLYPGYTKYELMEMYINIVNFRT